MRTEIEIFKAAQQAVFQLDVAVLQGDQKLWQQARDDYESLVEELNGGTRFGSYKDDDSPGYRIARYCAAVPGEVPSWGQVGEFFLDLGDVRMVVKAAHWFSCGGPSFSMHAVDQYEPFISETGYRSIFLGQYPEGLTVDEALAEWASCQNFHLVQIEARYRLEAFEWLDAKRISPIDRTKLQADAGQMALI